MIESSLMAVFILYARNGASPRKFPCKLRTDLICNAGFASMELAAELNKNDAQNGAGEILRALISAIILTRH